MATPTSTTATNKNNLALSPNAFQKCAPNIATNIQECGSVTLCNAIPMTLAQLQSSYTSSGNYLVMESLLKHDMEIKMCSAKQNGLYDFLMANKVNVSHKIQSQRMNSGLIRIAPFILARQYTNINNEYWDVSNGTVNGAYWQVDVTSPTGIPANARSFGPGNRVFIDGVTAGGTNIHTEYTIVSSTLSGNTVVLVLNAGMAGSYLPSTALTSPTIGILTRGTANINDYEKFCDEPAAYLNWNDIPFWVETMRTSMCTSENYELWRKLILADNALYREYGDLDEIEKNRQLGADWQKRMVNMMFWGKATNANQTLTSYPNLPQINSYPGGIFNAGGAQCVGVRADMVGIYEQMAQCGRVVDLQGANLNLIALFNAIYQMMRVKEGSNGKNAKVWDIFTDSQTAEAINVAMIGYYNAKSGNTLRLNYDVNGGSTTKPQHAQFGFNFRSFDIFYPMVTINIISHYYFDDYLTAKQQVFGANDNSGRFLWVLDFAGIYPGIMASNRKVNNTGDLKTLAAIDTSYACVMETFSQSVTLTSATMTMIVECPGANLLLENFPLTGMVVSGAGSTVYPPAQSGTTTTTTLGTIFLNTLQSYTANCPTGYQGTPVTVSSAAGSFVSSVSQADANGKALSAATMAAQSQLQCTPIQNP